MSRDTVAGPSDGTRGLLRDRGRDANGRVTNIELFFDLVFVYAVTQLSHTLLGHLSIAGAFEVLLLFLAVWWVWIFTGWITNWLDPERLAVRIMLLVLMLAGLLLSTALPDAFGEYGAVFACAYVLMQVGRTFFMLWALGRDSPANTRNFQRIAVWFCLAGVCWLIGGFSDLQMRWMWWVTALAIEYIGPAALFYVPGLGRSSTTDWDIEGGHLAERCSLFVLIALGESIVVTGSTFAETARDPSASAALVTAFIGSVAMWWIYFDLGAERGSRAIRRSSDPGRYGRLAYTYLHLLIVAGIVVCAVGDETSIAHPAARVDATQAMVLIGGPMLYLLGSALFKKTVNRVPFPLSHLVGLGLLVVLVVPSLVIGCLWLSVLTSMVLVVVAAWETWALRGLRATIEEDKA
ncbi:MAG TPA: low temperature requirement protein A [Dyella sp.]|uniref:low temperature requirement protein A n=1 Tax=Dyella sp. TaxID=1869338 RepID=UPI002F956606